MNQANLSACYPSPLFQAPTSSKLIVSGKTFNQDINKRSISAEIETGSQMLLVTEQRIVRKPKPDKRLSSARLTGNEKDSVLIFSQLGRFICNLINLSLQFYVIGKTRFDCSIVIHGDKFNSCSNYVWTRIKLPRIARVSRPPSRRECPKDFG